MFENMMPGGMNMLDNCCQEPERVTPKQFVQEFVNLMSAVIYPIADAMDESAASAFKRQDKNNYDYLTNQARYLRERFHKFVDLSRKVSF